MKEYAVWGETKDGHKVLIRRGFDTREEAESHPIILAVWARVWVELFVPAKKAVGQ